MSIERAMTGWAVQAYNYLKANGPTMAYADFTEEVTVVIPAARVDEVIAFLVQEEWVQITKDEDENIWISTNLASSSSSSSSSS